MAGKWTPEPWAYVDRVGAGIEIGAVLPAGFKFDATCHNADGKTWFMVYTLTGPTPIMIGCERWVQFETQPWAEMQSANAFRIVACVNALAGIPDPSAVGRVIEAARAMLNEIPAMTTGTHLAFSMDRVSALRSALAGLEGGKA